MMYTSYKDRTIDFGKKVKVYRCLNRKGNTYSIKQDELVKGHTDFMMFKNCTFTVNEAGRNRCTTTGHRNVHAYFEGVIVTEPIEPMDFLLGLKYSPKNKEGFVAVAEDHSVKSIKKALMVSINNNKITVSI
jgi:hypothetical protein